LNILLNEALAELAACQARIAEPEYENLALKRDIEYSRSPAREREYCPKCGKPREQHCPDCGAAYPD
jgi:hypothetical protein